MTTFRSGAGWSDALDPEDSGFPDNERYEWQDVVGAGGMGAVHVAHDRRLDRPVALKQMRRTPRDPRTSLLTWEAWVAARLDREA